MRWNGGGFIPDRMIELLARAALSCWVQRGLGPLIGTRTWGGLIGISGNPSLLDGGSITAPTFRLLGTNGAWEVEGIGVSPDIEVIDAPELMAQGRDPSLERGVQELLKWLADNPPRPIVSPPTPGSTTR